MTDYSKLTNDELENAADVLHNCYNMDLDMDGSGDCGEMISASYAPDFEAIEDEMQKRGMNTICEEDDNIDGLPF